MKKWKLGVGIAALLAAVSMFIILLQIEKTTMMDFEKTEVYAVLREIPEGMRMTEADFDKYIERVQVDAKIVPDKDLKAKHHLYGKRACISIPKGTILSTEFFEAQEPIPENMKVPVIVGVKADDLFQVAGGILRAGDRIHICMISDTGEADIKWENVVVAETFNISGTKIKKEDEETAAQRINLYIEKNQVEKFYEEMAKGSLRAIKVCD